MQKIAVLDYGMGNLHSVAKAIENSTVRKNGNQSDKQSESQSESVSD